MIEEIMENTKRNGLTVKYSITQSIINLYYGKDRYMVKCRMGLGLGFRVKGRVRVRLRFR